MSWYLEEIHLKGEYYLSYISLFLHFSSISIAICDLDQIRKIYYMGYISD
jgi:hypothetical protein